MPQLPVLVVGGGIIGAATVYQLALRGVDCVLLERAQPACAASGKAGGFLARSWCGGQLVEQLAERSFDMHAEFAAAVGHETIGYRRLEAVSVGLGFTGERERPACVPSWVDGGIYHGSVIGSKAESAQVTPEKLVGALLGEAMKLAKLGGFVCEVVTGAVVRDFTCAGSGPTRVVAAVLEDGRSVEGAKLALCCGPWTTPLLSKALGAAAAQHRAGGSEAAASVCDAVDRALPAILGQKVHSFSLYPEADPETGQVEVLEHAIFCAGTISPEIYPRPDGEVYVCGLSVIAELPDDPLTIQPQRPGICTELREVVSKFSSIVTRGAMQKEQACFLPLASGGSGADGEPVIGAVPSADDWLYIAAGHSCWGILNSHGTGEALAECIVGGSLPSYAEPLDPARYTAQLVTTAPINTSNTGEQPKATVQPTSKRNTTTW